MPRRHYYCSYELPRARCVDGETCPRPETACIRLLFDIVIHTTLFLLVCQRWFPQRPSTHRVRTYRRSISAFSVWVNATYAISEQQVDWGNLWKEFWKNELSPQLSRKKVGMSAFTENKLSNICQIKIKGIWLLAFIEQPTPSMWARVKLCELKAV